MGWWEQLVIWASDTGTYLQGGLILGTIIIASVFAAFFCRLIPWFRPVDETTISLRKWLLFRTGRLAYPLFLLFFLSIAAAISQQWLGRQDIVDAATRLAGIYLLWVGLKAYVTHPFVRALGLWVLVPAALLHLFGQLTPLLEQMDQIMISFGDVAFSLLHLLKTGLAGLVLFWLGRISSYSGQNYIRSRESIEVATRELLAKLFEITIYVVVFLLLLNVVGLDLSALAVFGGALGVGLGFGLQKIASNFVSGMILLFEKSVRIGDVLEMDDGTFGRVTKLGARASTIHTYDGKEVLIPNEDFIVSRIVNWTHSDKLIRYEIPFGVSYNTDIHKVPPAIEAAVAKHRQVLTHPEKPDCELQEFGDSSVNFTVEFWVEGVNDGKKPFCQ